MNYADKIGVPFIILLGEDEIKENAVSVKDMRSGRQVKTELGKAEEYIKAQLREREKLKVICE